MAFFLYVLKMISLGLQDGVSYLPGTIRITASPVLSLTAQEVIEQLKTSNVAQSCRCKEGRTIE